MVSLLLSNRVMGTCNNIPKYRWTQTKISRRFREEHEKGVAKRVICSADLVDA